MGHRARHLLLTGRPGSGKTTLLRKLAARLPGPPVGFWTEEVRVGGVRRGFRVVTTWGASGRLAAVGLDSPLRVGRYGVDLTFLEDEAIPGTLRAVGAGEAAFVLIDEIGKMELHSAAFRQAVETVVESGRPLLATVGQVSDPLLDRLASRPDVRVVTVAPASRDRLARILAWQDGWQELGGSGDLA